MITKLLKNEWVIKEVKLITVFRNVTGSSKSNSLGYK